MATKRHKHDNAHQLRHLFEPKQIVRTVQYLWSSDVNREAVAKLDPQPGEHILDLGAGLGPATIEVAKSVAPTGWVSGVDPSRFMRTVLQLRRSWQRNRGRIAIRQGSGESLPFPDGTVDAAMSLNVMHHLADLEATGVELARVLRPGGRLILIDEDFGHQDHSLQSTDASGSSGPDLIDLEEAVDALTGAGFVNVEQGHTAIGGQPCLVITANRSLSA